MNETIPLFALNPAVDRKKAAREFRRDGRVQIRDFLDPAAASTIGQVLARETPWGLAWQAGADGPNSLRRSQIAATPPAALQAIPERIAEAAAQGDYSFVYAQYQMLTAYTEGWADHQALDLLMEHINAEPLLNLVREVTGISSLTKADAQATLYGPNHFLAPHDDSHVAEGWRVAYVMNFCAMDWRPEWGGYLLFHDEQGDVTAGLKPRFNSLNMFKVPQRHSVSYVPPFAPVGRFGITGWFRDR